MPGITGPSRNAGRSAPLTSSAEPSLPGAQGPSSQSDLSLPGPTVDQPVVASGGPLKPLSASATAAGAAAAEPPFRSLDDYLVRPKPSFLRKLQQKMDSKGNGETSANSGPPLPHSSSQGGSAFNLDAHTRPVSGGLPPTLIKHGINPFSTLKDQASLSQANKALNAQYRSDPIYQKQIVAEKELYNLRECRRFVQAEIESLENFRPEGHEHAPGRLQRMAAFFGRKPRDTLTNAQLERAIDNADSQSADRGRLERLRLELAEYDRSIAALIPRPQLQVDMDAPD